MIAFLFICLSQEKYGLKFRANVWELLVRRRLDVFIAQRFSPWGAHKQLFLVTKAIRYVRRDVLGNYLYIYTYIYTYTGAHDKILIIINYRLVVYYTRVLRTVQNIIMWYCRDDKTFSATIVIMLLYASVTSSRPKICDRCRITIRSCRIAVQNM